MATRKDPYVNFNFLVEIDGITRAAFQEVSGLDSTIDVIEHREGGENITTRKFPGQVKYSNIILKWGMTDDVELYDWHQQWVDGDRRPRARTARSCCCDRQGQEKARWNFFNALARKVDRARPSTPKPTTSRSKRSSSPTKASSAHDTPTRRPPCSRPNSSSRCRAAILDEDGTLHRDGVMRRATAADEILPLKDPRVQKNEAYLIVILLSRVVTRLGQPRRDQSEGDRGPVRHRPRVPAGPLQPHQPRSTTARAVPTAARRRIGRSARRGSGPGEWSATPSIN